MGSRPGAGACGTDGNRRALRRTVPHRVSFKGALQTVVAHVEALREGTPGRRHWLWRILLESVADAELGHRPDRAEPRARKRRPKPYPLLMIPRQEAKETLLNAG
jgi:hypothetical protein